MGLTSRDPIHLFEALNQAILMRHTEICSNKLRQSTHYASEIKERAKIGNKVLQQYKTVNKVKFYVYLPNSKSSQKRDELIDRLRNLGGEVTYSVNKGINFLVVSDQVFKYTNNCLLKEGAIFTEAVQEQKCGKASAEKSFSKIKEVFNDRSLRLLSSSSSFAHNPEKFCNAILTPAKKYQPNTEFRNLYEFFNCKRWNLVSISDLTHKLDILESDSIDWHIEKGFHPPTSKEGAHIVLTSLREKHGKEPIIHSHSFHYNPKINKHDVSKMNLEAPDGTSIFQTHAENEMAEQNFAKLMNKHQGNVHKLKQIPS